VPRELWQWCKNVWMECRPKVKTASGAYLLLYTIRLLARSSHITEHKRDLEPVLRCPPR
jgi:hypothetical protein